MVREILCPGLLKNIPRHIGVKATAATEAGEHLAQGTFNFSQSDMGLASCRVWHDDRHCL